MLDNSVLHEYERDICNPITNIEYLRVIARSLMDEVRRLHHELDDPRYLYSGRINRQAIISRDAEIDELKRQLAIYKKVVSALSPEMVDQFNKKLTALDNKDKK